MKHFGLAAGAAALMMSVAPVMAQSPIANPQDLPKLYADAMAASDVETMVSFYAPNAILMTPEGPVAAGSDQIRTLLTRNFSGGAKLSMTFNQAQLDGGNGHAVTVWDWTLAVVVPGQEQPVQRHVRSMLYLKQQGETWSITADMYQILPQ
jgi:uncharacterized protein (TIGR02246 family)